MLTRQTDIVDFEVVIELDVAWSPVTERRLDDIQRASASSGTSAVQHVQHVHVASDVAKVGPDAAADLHPTVDGTQDNENLTRPVTVSVEPGVVTILASCRRRVCWQRQRRRQGHCNSVIIVSLLLAF